MTNSITTLIEHWKKDPNGVYRSWFLWEERIKNFGSIRRGVSKVIEEIETNKFGNTYRGSSLETVLGAIAEQKQIFKGADHAFVWKPKLRIPDIYENPENQMEFGRFLKSCIKCTACDGILEAVRKLDQKKIKGLGPAAANLMYFLHPTHMPPFNTAIVKGYNALTGSRVKLGKWPEYLAMREGILRLNEEYRGLLSDDLGAIAGLLFDIGTGRYSAPAQNADSTQLKQWEDDLKKIREENAAFQKTSKKSEEGERTHTEIQGWLRDLGIKLGFEIWIAVNDKNRSCGSGRLGDGCLSELPDSIKSLGAVAEVISRIDILWLKSGSVVAAFEVEHTTSIYSGILRLCDLALCEGGRAIKGLYLVAPDEREEDVRQQLARPAFQSVSSLGVKYLPYGEFEKNRESMSRFGEGLKAIEAIARRL
ncbi:MAG: type II restriction endonuclease [Bdellovibrio sp.]|nr:type II restriction endonuclease [Bdellovibrio sp.]